MSDQEKAELAEQNMPLVWYVVDQYVGVSVERDELYSAALFGMAQALSAYDETRGIKFSTFAIVCMNRVILGVLRAYRKRRLDISYEGCILSPDKGEEVWNERFVAVTSTGNEGPNDVAAKIVVTDFVKHLPDREKEILILRMRGLRQREIAKSVGMSQPQIGRLLNKMRKMLWKELYLR